MIIETATAIYILLGLVVLLGGWIIRLEMRMKRLLSGGSAASLESTILDIQTSAALSHELHEEKEEILRELDQRLHGSIQRVDTVRFSAFGEGGNQSFATVLLNNEGDGVVISSLYANDRVGIFAKPVKNYESEYSLSDEEKQVLRNVRG